MNDNCYPNKQTPSKIQKLCAARLSIDTTDKRPLNLIDLANENMTPENKAITDSLAMIDQSMEKIQRDDTHDAKKAIHGIAHKLKLRP